MPKIFLHYPHGTFTAEALASLAGELTTTGLECERIAESPYTRSTVWVYAQEYLPGHVLVGGSLETTPVVSVEVNAFEGGLDESAKKSLIERFTSAIGRHLGLPEAERSPVFVVIREVPASDWGIFGKQTTINELRHPDPQALPI